MPINPPPEPFFPSTIPKPEDNLEIKLTILLEGFLLRHRSEETRRAYRREVNGYLDWCKLGGAENTFGELHSLDLAELCNSIYLYCRSSLRFEVNTGRFLNPRTFNRRRHALSSFFKYLAKFYGFLTNPLVYIESLDTPNQSNTPDLDEHEVLAILHYLKKRAGENKTWARNFLIVLGLILEALRRREIAELLWDQINIQERSVRLWQKGNKEKFIPIPAGYIRLLEAFREKYGAPCPYVFHPWQNNRCGKLDKPISTDYIYKLVRSTAEILVPGKNISPHSFRATFVTLGLRWKVDINAIRNGTAHSTAGMVLYYDRRNPLENNFIHLLGDYFHQEHIFD